MACYRVTLRLPDSGYKTVIYFKADVFCIVWLWCTDVSEEPAAFVVRVAEPEGVVSHDDLVEVRSGASVGFFIDEDSPRGHHSKSLRFHLTFWRRIFFIF